MFLSRFNGTKRVCLFRVLSRQKTSNNSCDGCCCVEQKGKRQGYVSSSWFDIYLLDLTIEMVLFQFWSSRVYMLFLFRFDDHMKSQVYNALLTVCKSHELCFCFVFCRSQNDLNVPLIQALITSINDH